jgi:pyruvate formate lyase activating enzyme
MHEAQFYNKISSTHVQCMLCPHTCELKPGETGVCKARKNIDGKLINLGYGQFSAAASDPIEKKPLYHFHPGTVVLSIGGYGCNFRCNFCQNHSISQAFVEQTAKSHTVQPKQLVEEALNQQLKGGIAFTYNEPIINIEFMIETLKLAKYHNLPTSVVSNGYINPRPLAELIEHTDAFNIDLKAFTNHFYQKYTGGSLAPVLNAIQQISDSNSHLEITHLLITDTNDSIADFEAMCKWIALHAGKNTPLHVSRYFPRYKYAHDATNITKIHNFVAKANETLNYVYAGNTGEEANTVCPNCDKIIIERNGYSVKTLGLNGKKCLNCNTEIPLIL